MNEDKNPMYFSLYSMPCVRSFCRREENDKEL